MIPLKVIKLVDTTKDSYIVYFRWLDNIVFNVKKNEDGTYNTTIHGFRHDGDVFKITTMNDTEKILDAYSTQFDMLRPCVALVPVRDGKKHVMLIPSNFSPRELAERIYNVELVDDPKNYISEWFE